MTQTADWSESTATVDPGVLATIATVARNSERLEFSYRDRTGAEEDRHVEPIRLVMLGRRWYLVAYDLTRHDWRTFRVDRVEAPRSTGTQFRPRPVPTGDAAEYVRSSIQIATTRWEIVVEAETARRRGAPPRRAAGGGHRSRHRIGVVSPSLPTGSSGRPCCSPRSTPSSASSNLPNSARISPRSAATSPGRRNPRV